MVTQNAQMQHKVAVVDEVRTRIGDASASIVSEYRGLSVAELAQLRTALAAVGGDYRIFKNTLVRRAIDGGEYQPLSRVPERTERPDLRAGRRQRRGQGAEGLRSVQPAARHQGWPGRRLVALVVRPVGPGRPPATRRAAGPSRRRPGRPMQQMAGLLQALPRNLAYGISALIEQREAAGRSSGGRRAGGCSRTRRNRRAGGCSRALGRRTGGGIAGARNGYNRRGTCSRRGTRNRRGRGRSSRTRRTRWGRRDSGRCSG